MHCGTNVRNAFALHHLLNHVAIARLAAFGNDLFSAFAPKAYHLVLSLASDIFDRHHDLLQPFPGAWTSVTFDLGPQTVTLPSVHWQARSWCWIAITALGDFDSKHGGYLILWDLGRVLEFPPGCTVLIPAILRFSISKVHPGERRYSFTQYVAAPNSWERWPAATHLFSKLKDISSLRT
ncbi:hypothetical protein DFH06DRAFT_1013670 [Mycena polygramma]|nr:hypothetical protein DFH06DRAFT_1013670 [Mycena polygramma]